MDFDLYRVSQAERPKYKDALKYTYNMFYSPADDGYVATVLEMRGLSSIAETPLAALMGAIDLVISVLEGEKDASIEPLEHGQAQATYDKLLEHTKYNLDYLKENYPKQVDPYEGRKKRDSELAHEVHDSLEKLREKGLIRGPFLDYPLGEERAAEDDDELLESVLSTTDKPDVSTKSYHLITQIDEDDVFSIDWHYYELRYRGATVHPKFSLGSILCFAEMADDTVIEFRVNGIAELHAKFCKIVDDYLDGKSAN